jgi:hypothetical protein
LYIWSRRIVLGAECDDNMNFDIGLEEMLQPITKETSSRQNGDSTHRNKSTLTHTHTTSHRNKKVNVDKIKHVFIVLVLTNKIGEIFDSMVTYQSQI